MIDIKAANAALEDNFASWVKALRPKVTEIGPDAAVLEIPITEDIARVGGIVSGQALSALADTAMVFACAGHLGEFTPVATTNLETRFLRPGTGDTIRCTARVIRGGKALIFAEATLTALPADKPVAQASATFFKP
ncbi:PaaI family thioesterase [Pseudoprimorskyibacter insulae]|uniref:Thioesterase domain-containing protein n=1 Tax=Pseudoprimorskyibacter insulae TaxID=1695997 RepID=A0A2R8B164_9RHOB|nr:PaaI family thioesterase [Pseudoprimorskyibacter insulae]SPF81904.1 hypothetical protein PRI8871_03730 [Pseudoprimorskyibacter insulae]